MATIQKQVVVPFNWVPRHLLEEALNETDKRWNPFFDDEGRVMGFHAPKFGAILRSAYVIAEVDEESGRLVEIKKFQFDQMVRKDGPIDDPYGHATPNAMAVVVEERDDGYWVWAVNEWRPVIYDHRERRQGTSVVGVTGGWAKKVGAKPEQTALEELIAETGIEVDLASVEVINIHSPNRAYEEACNEIVLARFKTKGERRPDASHEVIGEQFPVRLDEFPLGPDALVNSALWAVARHLYCVSAKPLRAALVD